MLRLKKFDYIAILLSLTVIVIIAFSVYSGNYKDPVVKIESQGKVWIYPLDKDRIEEFEGPLGKTVVEISDNHVHITDSPCPDKLCIQAGILEKPGDWAACLPNRIIVTIEGSENEEIDDLNY